MAMRLLLLSPIALGFLLLVSLTGGPTYDVREFGAVGDGKTDDTLAVQAAIDSCSITGGKVLFPPGDYLTGMIELVVPVCRASAGRGFPLSVFFSKLPDLLDFFLFLPKTISILQKLDPVAKWICGVKAGSLGECSIPGNRISCFD